jgi:hypothetical protein
MRCLFVASVLWLSLVLSVHGVSVEIPITTTNLDQYKYRFSVSTNAATNGVAFHVIITAKRDDVPSDSTVGLSIVTHTKEPGGSTHSIEGVKPKVKVGLKKDKRVWAAEFTVPYQLLEKPGLCFVFTEFAHMIVDGKRVAMPSAVFYEIRLRDFFER